MDIWLKIFLTYAIIGFTIPFVGLATISNDRLQIFLKRVFAVWFIFAIFASIAFIWSF